MSWEHNLKRHPDIKARELIHMTITAPLEKEIATLQKNLKGLKSESNSPLTTYYIKNRKKIDAEIREVHRKISELNSTLKEMNAKHKESLEELQWVGKTQ